MAQLWLTYAELADDLGCEIDGVQDFVVRQGWTRKRSSDGLTRALVPADLMPRFITTMAKRIEALEAQSNEMVVRLQSAFVAMPSSETPTRLHYRSA